MLKIEAHNSLEDVMNLQVVWNELLSENDTNEVFLTFQWFQSWWEAIRENEMPLILTGTYRGNLVGVAPLAVSNFRKKKVNYRCVSFMGMGDYADVIAQHQYKYKFVSEVFDYLLKKRTSWDAIQLSNIPESSGTIATISQLSKERGLSTEVTKDMICPTMYIEGKREFAESCLRKKSIVRHHNYFRKNGDLDLINIRSRAEIESHLASFFEQHIKRRKLAGDSSLFLIPNRKVFYHRLIEFMPADWIDFIVLKFNGTPIAYHFGFFYNKKFLWYKPCFDVNYARHSPGEVLLRFLIERAIDMGATELDFTIGDEAFKRRFSNVIRHTYRVEYVKNKALYLYWKSTSHLRGFLDRLIKD